jgi:hypothetical protein
MVTVALVMLASCGRPARPTNVPSEAVRIPEPKGTDLWQYCDVRETLAIHCQIFNAAGKVLNDDTFIPYRGPVATSQSDLRIAPSGGTAWIDLENGAVLIPQGDYPHIKNFLDWQNGLRARP